METLGEIIGRLGDGSQVSGLLAQLADPGLQHKLETRAAALNRTPAEIARDAVHGFSSKADDDAWLKLLGRLQDAQSPAAACLAEMLAWSFKD